MQIGFFSLLTIVFVTLKLTEEIAWSWLWVFSPLWIGFLLYLALIIAIAGVKAYIEYKESK